MIDDFNKMAKKSYCLPVKGNIRLDNGEAILETAIASVGIVQLYNYVAAGAIASGKLKPILHFNRNRFLGTGVIPELQ
jgi:hypothetical protein